jgi:MobA/MobL family protein
MFRRSITIRKTRMAAVAIASWYHCSMKPISRSAGRSVVAAAAYRLGERLNDERYATLHDYTRRRGVETTFTVAPADAPAWAHHPESLWNEAERAETRKNSTLAREVELALPAFLSPEERQHIAERFAGELVERYGVAASVAIHAPGRGDDRNYHAHILFTTREMTPDGLGKKTRVLDARDTGPQEVMKLRELAADIINESLEAAHSDIRVDHRSFAERGIEQEPTTHLGPAASEMERRGEASERGEVNRQAERSNELMAERDALDAAIAREQERINTPPTEREDARARVRDEVAPLKEAIQQRGTVADIQSTADGLKWWQRAAVRIAETARDFVMSLSEKVRDLWQWREQDKSHERDDRGLDR